MAEPFRILILGGTRNARDLAIDLDSRVALQQKLDVTISLAGRTEEPDRTFGKTRIGGFGGASGLAGYLIENKIHLLVDATHPFASTISNNARIASDNTGIRRLVLNRPQWEIGSGDQWIDCADIDEAAEKLPSGATSFLALGHQYLTAFSHRDDIKFVARMVDKPRSQIPLPNHELVIAKPSHRADEEAELFSRFGITHLVSRNSGGNLVYAKIEAARKLGIPVLMIRRPPPVSGEQFSDIKGLADEIIRLVA